ncbi:MAG TPA: hypothetical protein DEP42_04020 [Ruminococcaceae bacterium]|nr:hypothetical protein [Oscillospiraceae bacterium]
MEVEKAEVTEGLFWLIFSIWFVFKLSEKIRAKLFDVEIQVFKENKIIVGFLNKRKNYIRSKNYVFYNLTWKIFICIVVSGVIILPGIARSMSEAAIVSVFVVWLVVLTLFIGGWVSKPDLAANADAPGPEVDKNNKAPPAKERGLIRQLCFLGSVSAVGFSVNQVFLRWPDADWIGLLLLWFATSGKGEEAENRNKFVEPVYSFISSIIDIVKFSCGMIKGKWWHQRGNVNNG